MQTLTIEEAAAALKVAPETIRRNLRSGTLPGIKVGRQWRVIPEELAQMRPQTAAIAINRQSAIEAARGAMKSRANGGNIVKTFLHEKHAEIEGETTPDRAGSAL